MESINLKSITVGSINADKPRRDFQEFVGSVKNGDYLSDSDLFRLYLSKIRTTMVSGRLKHYVEACAEMMTVISEDYVWPGESKYTYRLIDVDTDNYTARAFKAGFYFTLYHVQQALLDEGVMKVPIANFRLFNEGRIRRGRSKSVEKGFGDALEFKNEVIRNSHMMPHSLRSVVEEFSGFMDPSKIRFEDVFVGAWLALRILNDVYGDRIDSINAARMNYVRDEFDRITSGIGDN